MKEQLISFEIAKLAKEKGFSNICNQRYYGEEYQKSVSKTLYHSRCYLENNTCDKDDAETYDAPTQSLLQKWLREKKGLIVESNSDYNCTYFMQISHITKDLKVRLILAPWNNFKTYEEALEEGLKEALKLIEL